MEVPEDVQVGEHEVVPHLVEHALPIEASPELDR
jgi:hypothetical protein